MTHPDEEIGSKQAFELFIETEKFRSLNAGVALDEGLASPDECFSVFFGERLPWCTLFITRRVTEKQG